MAHRLYNILLIVFLCRTIISIIIRQDKTPIIYGETVTLDCIVDDQINDCDNMTDRTWEGGHKKGVLLYNGVSINKSKYEELTNNPCKKFSLVIHNFTENDGNANYSCSVGFTKTRKYLLVDSSNFLRKPLDNYSINYNTTQSVMFLSVHIDKVFPEPKCICKIRNSSTPMVNIKMESFTNKMFYDIEYFAGIKFNKTTCGTDILVSCTALSFTVLDTKRRVNCSNTDFGFTSKQKDDNKPGDTHLGVAAGVTCAAILLITIIMVIFCLKRDCTLVTKTRYKRTEQR